MGLIDMKEIFKKKTEESGAGSAPLGGTTWYGVDKLLFVRIGIAAVLLCLGLFLQLGDGITLLLLLLSTLISGFDVLYQAASGLSGNTVSGRSCSFPLQRSSPLRSTRAMRLPPSC